MAKLAKTKKTVILNNLQQHTNMSKYTFSFNRDEENKFNRIMARLDDNEYVVVSSIKNTDPPNKFERTCDLEMEEDVALVFRLGMKNLNIRRERSEEELAEEERIRQMNRVTILVVDPFSDAQSSDSQE